MEQYFNDMVADELLKRVDHPSGLILFNASKKLFTPKEEWQKHAKGIVFGKQGDLVSIPLSKTYNWHEKEAVRKQFRESKGEIIAAEKFDGTLIHMFYYQGKWWSTTRGSFESPEGEVDFINRSKALAPLDKMNIDFTYVFEYVCPENRILTNYGGEEFLALIALRNRLSPQKDYCYRYMTHHVNSALGGGVRLPRLVSKPKDQSIDDFVLSLSQESDERISEGYMLNLMDADNKYVVARVKVKTSQYVSALKAVRELSFDTIAKLMLSTGFAPLTESSLFDMGLPEELHPDALQLALEVEKAFGWSRGLYNDVLAAKVEHYEEGMEKRFAFWVKGNVLDKKCQKYYFMHIRGREISPEMIFEDLYLKK